MVLLEALVHHRKNWVSTPVKQRQILHDFAL